VDAAEGPLVIGVAVSPAMVHQVQTPLAKLLEVEVSVHPNLPEVEVSVSIPQVSAGVTVHRTVRVSLDRQGALSALNPVTLLHPSNVTMTIVARRPRKALLRIVTIKTTGTLSDPGIEFSPP